MVKGIRTYAVLFMYILQQCWASCLVAWFFCLFVCLFVCYTYVYACCCNILLYVKRQWFSLSFYTLIYLDENCLKPFTNVITTMAMNVCAPSTVVQRILPHGQHKAFTNGFLSKRLCCITRWAQCSNMSGVRLILSLDESHLSGKSIPLNSMCLPTRPAPNIIFRIIVIGQFLLNKNNR